MAPSIQQLQTFILDGGSEYALSFFPLSFEQKTLSGWTNTEEGRRIIMGMCHHKNGIKDRAASDGSYWRGCRKEPKTALEGRKEEGSLIECVLELVSQ